MLLITLPDGSQRPFNRPVTVADVAASIGKGLARAALAGVVDGKLVDTSQVIERDATLRIVRSRDTEGLEILRHSTAHLLAQAVQSPTLSRLPEASAFLSWPSISSLIARRNPKTSSSPASACFSKYSATRCSSSVTSTRRSCSAAAK